jgi:hypothetical protein
MKADNWWLRQLAEPPRRRWPNFLRMIVGFSCALAVTALMLYASVWVVQKDFVDVTASESSAAP